MSLFRVLAKNMAPMTNADELPYAFLTEHFSLYSIYSATVLVMHENEHISLKIHTFNTRTPLHSSREKMKRKYS